MDSLKDQNLVKSDGSSVPANSALAGKDLVLFYFSAHWCPPCRQFTPMLKDFYEVRMDIVMDMLRYMLVLQEVEGLEIVFVSSDRSPEDMQSYMKESHGDWLAVEHNSAVANDLKQKYGEISSGEFLLFMKYSFLQVSQASPPWWWSSWMGRW